MEILNNTELLFTTSNILYRLPFTFSEIYIGMLLFLTILNITTNRKSKILYVTISSLLTIMSNFIIPDPFNVFTNFIVYFILIVFIFKTSLFKSLLAVITPIATFGLISTLILNPYLTLFNITAEQLSSIPIYNTGYLLCLYTISIILLTILKFRNFKINSLEDLDKKNKIIILANFIFGIINLILQSCITFYYINKLPIIITFLSFISLAIYFAISIYSLTRILKLDLTSKKLQSAEEYNRSLCILHDNVRGFKHDFDNIVTTIGGYIRTNDIKGLESYYIQLEDDCQRVNNSYLLNPEVINNPRYIQFAC